MKTETSGFILGFDYGTKRIGVALGVLSTQQARPLSTVRVKQTIIPWVEIDKLIRAWQPKQLLVGLPLNMDGTEQPITYHAREFGRQLYDRYTIPIIEVDERLSSRMARDILFETGGYAALQDGQVDSMAAKLLLDQWFLGS